MSGTRFLWIFAIIIWFVFHSASLAPTFGSPSCNFEWKMRKSLTAAFSFGEFNLTMFLFWKWLLVDFLVDLQDSPGHCQTGPGASQGEVYSRCGSSSQQFLRSVIIHFQNKNIDKLNSPYEGAAVHKCSIEHIDV